MKRVLLTAVCGLSLATAASAASLTWSANGLEGPNGTAAELAGAIAYLFEGNQNTAALVAAITGGTFTGANALYSKTTTGTGGIAQANIVNANGGWTNTDATFYSVWFDGPTIEDSSYFRISNDVTLHFATVNQTLLFQDEDGNGRLTSTWTPIPEPTSMALLALGVAAVGLRRRFRK